MRGPQQRRQRSGAVSIDAAALQAFAAEPASPFARRGVLPGAPVRSVSPTSLMERIVPAEEASPRSRTPSPYTLEHMDGHERWLDEQRRKINNSYSAAASDLKSHYSGRLTNTFDHYASQEERMVLARQAQIDAIHAKFQRGVSEATEGEFHKAARTAVEKLEEMHALPGTKKKLGPRTMAQKRWAMVKTARILGSLDKAQQPEGFKEAVAKQQNKGWKKMRLAGKMGASFKGATADAAQSKLLKEGVARRKVRQRKLAAGGAFAERTGPTEVEWKPQQLRLLYLIHLVSLSGPKPIERVPGAQSYARRTPICVWIYEAIRKGVLNYPFYPTSELIGGRRTGINISAEALDDIDRLCAEAMMKAFRRTSRTYTSTTAYKVTRYGLDYLREQMNDADRMSVHKLIQADGIIEPRTIPTSEEMFYLVWDAEAREFSLTHPPTGRYERSDATTVEETSYVCSPHIPECLRDDSRTGGANPTTDNRDRVKELRVTKKSTAFRLDADSEPEESLTLRGVRVLVCEWLPFSSNQVSMLNDKLGAGDTVQGGFFSDRMDTAPQETIYKGAAEGLTAAYLLDFDETSYVNYEAEVFFPTEPGVVQIEHIGVHVDDSGLSVYGLRLDGVEARVGDTVNPALAARLLVDIRVDSSLLSNSVLEQRQRSMLQLLHGGDQDERDKYSVVMAESIKPMVEAVQYIDGQAWQCELQQLLGELGSAHELVARESAVSGGLVLLFGRRGILLAGKTSQQYEPLLLAYGSLRSRSIVLTDMTRRLQLLNDDVAQLRAEIAIAHLDPGRLHRARTRLRGLSVQCTTLVELHTVMQESMAHFKIPEAPQNTQDLAGSILHTALKYDVLVEKLNERIEDVTRTLETLKHTVSGLRDAVNDAANARLLRSRRETLRNSHECAAIAAPTLDGKLMGLVIMFAGLLAVNVVDAAMYNDSKAFGAVSIALSTPVDVLRSMCGGDGGAGGVCSGNEAFMALLSLMAFATPYALCWWFLAWLILKVARDRQALQRPVTVENLRIDRTVDVEALDAFLEHKNIVTTEVADDRGWRIITHRWKERADTKWNGMPPTVSVTVDATQGFLRAVSIEHSPARSALDQKQVRELVFLDLWAASPPLFQRAKDDVDDWYRFSELDNFVKVLRGRDDGARKGGLAARCIRSLGDPATICGRFWQSLL
jgi:hypothetical protein